MRNLLKLFFLIFTILKGIGSWSFNNRSHPELDWETIKTTHFDIHFHQEIREIALKGASIAEQIRPTLMKQMNLNTLPRLDIIFTSEDEILNGFAMPSNNTIIWVDQNDAALWNHDEKWIRTVLAHELQHLVYFNTIKGPWWLPHPMNYLVSGIPSWFVEGIAEYFTEKWRPFRYDISHKGHVIRNTVHKIKDPHNDGFSKTLYFAERFGDSTISKILNHRNKLGVLYFESAFKKYTGIKLKQFNEDWRRHMNTFYFGQRSQKERVEDVGKIFKLPINQVKTFDYFPDTMRIAMIGSMTKGQGDNSLVLAIRDTSKENKIFRKRLKKAKRDNKKAKRARFKWKLKELDHGTFGEMISNIDVSPDGNSIIYSKFGYGFNQSLVFDIWKYDLKTNKKIKLTKSMRANYPKFSPDNKSICFVAHSKSTTQLYIMDVNGKNVKQLTQYVGDIQIITPSWSPDGQSIAFAKSNQSGIMNLYLYHLNDNSLKQLTNSNDADYLPIWNPDGGRISFTGLYDYTPNLYTIDLVTGKIIQNTDIGDIVIGTQWNNLNSNITALTLSAVDTSRVVDINPDRVVNKNIISMNSKFSSWRNKIPDYPLLNINPKNKVKVLGEENYRFYKNITHTGTFVIPDNESLLLQTVFSDGLGRHDLGGLYFTVYSSEINSYAFQYRNSTGFPFGGFWGIDFYKDINFQFQYFNNEDFLVEFFNGFSFWGSYPYNFGNNLTTNHFLDYSIQFLDRNIVDEVFSPIFGNPESGQEESLNFRYAFLNKRNHRRNLFLPNQGFGFELRSKFVSDFFRGDFNYSKFEVDLFSNQKMGAFTFYGRTRYEVLNGDNFPSQEKLGIFDIPNYYIAGSLVPGREYMSLRGYNYDGLDQYQTGNQAIMSTIELRAPVVPVNLVEFLKIIKIGQPTIALISDFGTAWNSKLNEKFKKDAIIVTSGLEFRLALTLSNMPLFIFSYGWAQELRTWKNKIRSNNGNIIPNPYFQMTLINPF